MILNKKYNRRLELRKNNDPLKQRENYKIFNCNYLYLYKN